MSRERSPHGGKRAANRPFRVEGSPSQDVLFVRMTLEEKALFRERALATRSPATPLTLSEAARRVLLRWARGEFGLD